MFWGGSAISEDIFKVQKRAIRIITNKCGRESCRTLFKQLKILTLFSQYVVSVLVFMTRNMNLCTFNREIHSINTRSSFDLHLQSTNLSVVQKVYYTQDVKCSTVCLSTLKPILKIQDTSKKILKNYPIEHSLYSMDEYYHLTAS